MNEKPIKNRRNRLLSSLFLTYMILCSAGCGNTGNGNGDEAADWADKTLAGLTLEKKVAQLICTDISGDYVPSDDPRYLTWLRLAGQYGVGGFVLYGGTPQNVANLLNRLQKEASIPLLISADFEGGPGQQVKGASEFPGNMAFAATRDEVLMYEAAKIMAEEGRSMGIHLSYTPVTDVSISPENPQESVRSFGGDIELNGRMLKAYVRGYHESGMLTTAKHFPGRGNMTALGAYPGFNYLPAPAEEIRKHEFRAFQLAVDAGVDFIMTEHLAVPSVTEGSLLPASVEPKLIKGIVRQELGFKGMITTDDLWYDYVTSRFGAEDIAVRALEAGHDIILKPKDAVATIAAITAAVKKGRISEKQIDQSVRSLLIVKARLGLNHTKTVDAGRIGEVVGTIAHQTVIQKVADKSVTLLRNEGILPLKNPDFSKSVHIIVQKEEEQPGVAELTKKMAAAFKGLPQYRLKPDQAESHADTVKKACLRADFIFVSFFVQRVRFGDPAPIREKDLKLIREIIAAKPGKVLGMSFGNPHLLRKIESIPGFLTGYGEGGWYGNQPVYFDSFIRIIKGELAPSGKLPVEVNRDYPAGFGLTY